MGTLHNAHTHTHAEVWFQGLRVFSKYFSWNDLFGGSPDCQDYSITTNIIWGIGDEITAHSLWRLRREADAVLIFKLQCPLRQAVESRRISIAASCLGWFHSGGNNKLGCLLEREKKKLYNIRKGMGKRLFLFLRMAAYNECCSGEIKASRIPIMCRLCIRHKGTAIKLVTKDWCIYLYWVITLDLLILSYILFYIKNCSSFCPQAWIKFRTKYWEKLTVRSLVFFNPED